VVSRGTHRPHAVADRTPLEGQGDRGHKADATLRPAAGGRPERSCAAQRLHRGPAERRIRL